MESILKDTLGNITNNALEICEHIPPQVAADGKFFSINLKLFDGKFTEWFLRKHWEEAFDSSEIVIPYNDSNIALPRMMCQFFGTFYVLGHGEIIHIYPSEPSSLAQRISVQPRFLKCVATYRTENVCVESLEFDSKKIKNVADSLGKPPVGKPVKGYERKILAFEIVKLAKTTDDAGAECIFTQSYQYKNPLQYRNGGFLQLNVDNMINNHEEAIQLIKTKSVLYHFFSLLRNFGLTSAPFL